MIRYWINGALSAGARKVAQTMLTSCAARRRVTWVWLKNGDVTSCMGPAPIKKVESQASERVGNHHGRLWDEHG